MPTAPAPPEAVTGWCGHRGRYQVTAILCGPRGWSDRMMACGECGRKYLASELAAWRTGYQHTQPRGARPPEGITTDHPAHERAGPHRKEGHMSVPTSRTGNPKARQKAQAAERQTEDMGEGHIMGNLTADPELRYTPTGRAVASCRVAYTPRSKDEGTGKWADGETEFYGITVWGQQGENCAEFLQRGDRVVAAGTWTKRFWEDKDGEERESIELTARDIGPSLLFKGATVTRTKRSKGRDDDD